MASALYLNRPFFGSRRMAVTWELAAHAFRRLMRILGIENHYPKRNFSRPVPGHEIYPYLLRGVSIERLNQVWSIDITYLPMHGGFLYLVAIMDWFSRFMISWELISMDGRGRALDNVFIERLLRSLKYELIYPGDFVNGADLFQALDRYFHFYNHQRPHQLGLLKGWSMSYRCVVPAREAHPLHHAS